MALFLPHDSKTQRIDSEKLTLTQITRLIGGAPTFRELNTGDLLAIRDEKGLPLNKNASMFDRSPVYGDAILCTPDELA